MASLNAAKAEAFYDLVRALDFYIVLNLNLAFSSN